MKGGLFLSPLRPFFHSEDFVLPDIDLTDLDAPDL